MYYDRIMILWVALGVYKSEIWLFCAGFAEPVLAIFISQNERCSKTSLFRYSHMLSKYTARLTFHRYICFVPLEGSCI